MQKSGQPQDKEVSMDRFTRKISMLLARQTTRRDFLSGVVRGAVGAGLGASMLFGGEREAFAAGECQQGLVGIGCGTLPCTRATQTYYSLPGGATTACRSGGANEPLCSTLVDDNGKAIACGASPKTPCPAGSPQWETAWLCCCGNQSKYCYVCTVTIKKQATDCKCPFNTAAKC
jgi:hypothetical protein